VGFVSAECNFFVGLSASPNYRTGFNVRLSFSIGQHIRDEQLIKSLVEYLGCGTVYKKPKSVEFVITKLNDLENKLLPFLKNHPVIGEKLLDYLDFTQALDIIKNKAHLTEEGLEKIRQIKTRMNKARNLTLIPECKENPKFIQEKVLGRKKFSEDTKLRMATIHGNPVNVYEKCSSEGFKLIGSFVSARRAGNFLGMSGSTVNRYVNSGAIFKERYKFSSPLRGHPQPPLGGGRGIK
jgi:hypothetical protein